MSRLGSNVTMDAKTFYALAQTNGYMLKEPIRDE